MKYVIPTSKPSTLKTTLSVVTWNRRLTPHVVMALAGTLLNHLYFTICGLHCTSVMANFKTQYQELAVSLTRLHDSCFYYLNVL